VLCTSGHPAPSKDTLLLFEAESDNAHNQFAVLYIDSTDMFCSDVRHRHSWESGTTPAMIVKPGKVTASSTHAAES